MSIARTIGRCVTEDCIDPARILETALGEALGPAEHGGRRRGIQVPHKKLENGSSKVDRNRFRLMAEHRAKWWPELEKRSLSRADRRIGLRELPVKLTKPGELVFDPFCGSGTTAVAAKQLGRRFITCDIDADALAIARKRIAETEPAGKVSA